MKLPDPWVRIESPFTRGIALDEVLGLDQHTPDKTPGEYRQEGEKVLPITREALISNRGQWQLLENSSTKQRVLVRLQQIHVDGPIVIGAVAWLPPNTDYGITGMVVRDFPIAAIEVAYNDEDRLQKRSITDFLNRLADIPETPLGRPNRSLKFYENLAATYLRHERNGLNGISEIAKENDVPAATVKGWVTAARKQHLLPPAKRGRRKK